MDQNYEAILSLCRDAMLVLKERRLVSINAAAAAIFPELQPGENAVGVIPDHILFEEAPRFAGSAVIGDREYTVNCAAEGDMRMITLIPRGTAEIPRYVSDGMMTQLLSKLGNAMLAESRISKCMKEDDPEQRRWLSLLCLSHHALRRHLNNLNLAGRLREDAAWFSPREVELVEFCSDLIGSTNTLLGDRGAELSFSSPLPELIASVDESLLERLLLNLLANSLEHTPAGGWVRLRLTRSGENAILSVEDNGEGIKPEIMQHVFTRYACRADRNHIDRAGTAGLGLTIASGIASLHRGVLVIESREGEGTSVRVMLPLEQPEQVTLYARDEPHPDGLEPILTELSDLLPPEVYSEVYLD